MTAEEASRIERWGVEHVLKPCAIAFFFVLVAALWTLLLQHEIAYPFVFLFFGAVMGSAWFGGLISGLIAAALSTVLVTYFFIPPLYSMRVESGSESFLAAFVLSAIAITIVSSTRKRAENAIRAARDELEAKVQERTAELQWSNQEIKESERQLRLLTEAIPQQLWRADAEGRIEYCNQPLRDYLGQRPEELRGRGLPAVVHPEDEGLYSVGWRAALERGEGFEAEVRVRSAEGAYRWFLVRSLPQRAEDGRVAKWYGIHIDIEEQRRAQQELVFAQEDLARLSRTMSMAEMAASIAHELNQPMTAVVTHAYACREWLRSEPANVEKASATAEKIVQETTRASEVVKRVRALFRKEAQTRERTDVNGLIRELARLLRDEAIRRNVTIRLALDEGVPELEVDQVQIQQVLLNLATNGLEAMAGTDGSRTLTIRSERSGEDAALVAVEDQGPGIPEEIAAQIFEPFFTTKPQGMGMGLAICHSIVEAHEGRLWASNRAGGGAVFQFTVRTPA